METKECRGKIQDESETEPRKSDSSSKSRKELPKQENLSSVVCVVKHCATNRAYLFTSELTLVKNLIGVTNVERDLHLRRL